MSEGGLSEQRLAEIEARDKARTPGEWEHKRPCQIIGHSQQAVVKRPDDFDWICSMQVSNQPNFNNDAAFIAACSVDVPELLEEVRRLKQQGASMCQCRRELLVLLAWAAQRTHDLREPLRTLGLPSDIDGRTAFIRWLNTAADEGRRIIEEAESCLSRNSGKT